MDELIKKHIMTIFFGIILSVLITGAGMIFSSNTKNAVFETQFGFLKKNISDLTIEVKNLRDEVKISGKDKWTKADAAGHNIQYQYFKDNTLRLYEKLEERIRSLEQKTLK